jgi:hypothetical protein
MQKRTVGIVATFVAALVLIGGAAEAKGLLTGKDIKDKSLTGKDIKDGSLTLKDFKGSERVKLRGPAGANATLNTITVQSPTVRVAAFDIGSVSASCPAGMKITGGGYFVSVAIAASNQPITNGWGVVVNNSNNSIPVDVSAYAVCA